jgi:hypothetical protein
MHRRLPVLAIILTALGILPFLLAGIGSLGLDPAPSLAAAYVLIIWGAVVLSFIGGVHWGLTLATPNDPVERPRLLFGVVPPLMGWAAGAVAFYARQPVLGIIVLIACYLLVAGTEWHWHRKEWVPGGYIGLRMVGTAIVVLILIVVLGVRLIGGHLMF